MVTRPLIKESLLLLNLNGLNPTKQNIFTKLNALSSILLTSGFGIECALEVIWEWKGLVSLDSIVAIIAGYQTVSKLIVMILYREKLKQIIDCMHQHYWPLSKGGNELELKFQYISSIVRRIMITVLMATAVTILTYVCVPIFYKDRRLPYATYHPKDLSNSPNYEIAYLLVAFTLLKAMPPSVLAFDFLFISLIVHIVFELQMINKQVNMLTLNCDSNEDYKSALVKIKVIGSHHSMVLRCVRYMKDIYSIVLLNQFLTVMFLVCMGLLFIIVTGFPPPLTDLVKVAGYTYVFSTLLFLYCIAGAYLTFECENIANAAYQSKWWTKTQPKLRRSIALMILRAHKPETLSAGGMINLNLESFSNVVRSGLSFFMVVHTLFSKKEAEF